MINYRSRKVCMAASNHLEPACMLQGLCGVQLIPMSSMQVDVLGEDLKFYINNIIFLLFYIKLQKYNSLRSSIEKALIFTNLKMYLYSNYVCLTFAKMQLLDYLFCYI